MYKEYNDLFNWIQIAEYLWALTVTYLQVKTEWQGSLKVAKCNPISDVLKGMEIKLWCFLGFFVIIILWNYMLYLWKIMCYVTHPDKTRHIYTCAYTSKYMSVCLSLSLYRIRSW